MKKSILSILLLLFGILLISIFYYYEIIKEPFYILIKILLFLSTITIISYILEKPSYKIRCLTALRFTIPFIIFSIILSITNHKLSSHSFIFYGMILCTSLIGSYIKQKTKRKKA